MSTISRRTRNIIERRTICCSCEVKYCVISICDAQIQRNTNLWYWAEYSTFSITDEVGKYRLTVSGYSGDADDAMAAANHPNRYANGMMFSTPGTDNDADTGGDCAGGYLGGWWFGQCTSSGLNKDDIVRWSSGNPSSDVQSSRMLVTVY